MAQPVRRGEPWFPLITPRRRRLFRLFLTFLRTLPGVAWPFLIHVILAYFSPLRYATTLLFSLPPPLAFLLYPARKSPFQRFKDEWVWIGCWAVFGPLYLFWVEPFLHRLVSPRSSGTTRPPLSRLIRDSLVGLAHGSSPLGHALHWALFWLVVWVVFCISLNAAAVLCVVGYETWSLRRSRRALSSSSSVSPSFALHLFQLRDTFDCTLRRAESLPPPHTSSPANPLPPPLQKSPDTLQEAWAQVVLLSASDAAPLFLFRQRLEQFPLDQRASQEYQMQRLLLLALEKELRCRRRAIPLRESVAQLLTSLRALFSSSVDPPPPPSTSSPPPQLAFSSFFLYPFPLWSSVTSPPPPPSSSLPPSASCPPLDALFSTILPFLAACSAFDPTLKPEEVLLPGLAVPLRWRDVRRAEERLLEGILEGVLLWKEAMEKGKRREGWW